MSKDLKPALVSSQSSGKHRQDSDIIGTEGAVRERESKQILTKKVEEQPRQGL